MWWKRLLKTVLAAVAGMVAGSSSGGMESMSVTPEIANSIEVILMAVVAIILTWIRSPKDD